MEQVSIGETRAISSCVQLQLLLSNTAVGALKRVKILQFDM